jgi:YidC/Oxa1 family membrane protein insertase
MDNRRFILFCALGAILFLMYQAWQKDHAPKPPAYAESAPAPAATAPEAPAAPDDELPAPGPAAKTPVANAGPAASESAGEQPLVPGQVLRNDRRVVVTTDVLRAEIDTYGGDLRRLELLGVPVSKAKADVNLHLLNDRLPSFFIAQSGLVDTARTAPSHSSLYKAEREQYQLAEGQDSLDVKLEWQDASGRRVSKVYRFHRGDYAIELRHEVANGAAEAWALSPYVQFWRTPHSESEDPPFIKTFHGVGYYEQKNGGSSYRFAKVRFDDLQEEPLALEQVGGWNAVMENYFIGAVIPPAQDSNRFYAKPRPIPGGQQQAYVAGYVGPVQNVAPGGQALFESKLFLGPKLQDRLADVAPGFELTVDYGALTILAKPLFWLLEKLHKLVGNWGFAIVLLTLVVKLSFWKLSEAQYRAMARMKKFTPRIQQIKERYADDREGMQKAMMDLYKKEGFNPLAGCWPLLVQFPVFIALYWVLLQSVELRQAPFILWIQDMSSPDPFWVLPVLFGISMWTQQRLSGTSVTMDEMQQKVMMAMPIMLTVFFGFFPAGLVLYWLVSNLIGIAQQFFITRKIEREETAKA